MDKPEEGYYDAVFLAVPHNEYASMSAQQLRAFAKDKGILFDLKGVLPLGEVDIRL